MTTPERYWIRWAMAEQEAKERADLEFWNLVRRDNLIEAQRLYEIEHGYTAWEADEHGEEDASA